MEDQRTDCKYISQKCPNYSPDAYTCNHSGGDYCGKFRWYENRITIRKILAKTYEYMKFYFIPFFTFLYMIVFIVFLSHEERITWMILEIATFSFNLIGFIIWIPRWIK